MDERALIERAVRGDASAFNDLMAGQEKRMFAVAMRMFGSKEDAEDCLQDAMLRIYRSIKTFKFESSFATWVYRVTMNTCLDELRRRKNRASTSLDSLLDSGWAPTDGHDTPEQHAVRSEARRSISAFIQELPEDMRAAVVLRDIQGLSYDDIAVALNTNVGTVKSRISRGREKLREKIRSRSELFDRYGV